MTQEKTVPGNNSAADLRRYIILTIGFFGAVFHIYFLGFSTMDMWLYRTYHVGIALIIVFLTKPVFGKTKGFGSLVDAALIVATIYTTAYITMHLSRLSMYLDFAPKPGDIVVCAIGVVLVLEMTRRATGLAMPILATIFILYALFGNHLPGLVGHKGYAFGRLMAFEYSVNGVFGTAVGVSATYVILFVIFGAVLEGTGGGRLMIDSAVCALGRYRGGPAKAAIFASAGMGTISGSSAANVVTTGAFTIPLMQKVGYNKVFAGAVEAVASTGGQIMPPIMGAGAFLMAEAMGVPYSHVAKSAIIPAIIYFLSVYIMVDIEAIKTGLVGLKKEELPVMKTVFREVGHLIIPLAVLIYFLAIVRSTPIRAALWSIYISLIIAMLRSTTRYDLKKLVGMFSDGMKDAVGVIAACACAGLIVGVLSMTGLGSKLVVVILSLSGGNLILALVLTMLVTMILGMGLPTTASYIICSSVVIPALVKMGLQPLNAHFFVFYFACLSSITPPVAIAAYAAAGLTGANANTTGYAAFRLGLAAFVVPYMFVYSDALLMVGSAPTILRSFVTAVVGTFFFASGISGWLKHKTNLFMRLLLIATSLLLIDQGLITDIIGIAMIPVCYALQTYVFKDKSKE